MSAAPVQPMPAWSPAADRIIAAHYGKMPNRRIAQALGRTTAQVVGRSRVLGIQEPPRPWTAREDALLRRYYRSDDSAAIRALIELCQRPSHQVKHHAWVLGLSRTKERRWTPADETALQLAWGREPDAVVAQRLKRTVTACVLKARRMGWCRSKGVRGWMGRELGRLFGVDEHKVIKQWIAHGWITATRLPFQIGSSHPYLFREDVVLAFIRTYPHEYNWRKMHDPSGYYQRIARQVWEADPLMTTSEVATRACLSVTCVSKWALNGSIPAIRGHTNGNAGVWWYRTSDLPAILAALPKGGWKKQRKAVA